jgi:mannan endo-1,4-beta-mannosidase
MGVYDMMDSSERNIQNTISWAKKRLAMVDQWSRKVNKPMVLEEFGLARDNWNTTVATRYSPNNPTTNRDRYFKEILEYLIELRQGSCAGFGVWAYAGEARPGDKWIADPSVEPAGWYSIYDKDITTFNVLNDIIKATQ